MSKVQQPHPPKRGSNELRVGFVPLTDCAPLAMAQELELYEKYNIEVRLSRELGWATIRDKIIYGELDAAHAVAGLPVAAAVGLGSVRSDCITGVMLSSNGNAITISNELSRAGVNNPASLRAEVSRLRGERMLTFGVVSLVSSHHFLLRGWLAAAGVNPDRDVRIVVVPPPQMVANLKAGNLDGYCVGEPWNSVAVQSRVGTCVAVSSELEPGHPEKVLMVHRNFAEEREDEHLALIAALLEACEYCENPRHHEDIIKVLAHPQYVGVPAASLRAGFSGQFECRLGKTRNIPDFHVFHRDYANEPSADKAAWVLQRMRACGFCKDPNEFNSALGRRVFRTDIYEKALQFKDGTITNNDIDHEPKDTALAFV